METSLTSVLKAICLSLLGVSLAACTGEQHKKQSGSEVVPVIIGRVQKFRSKKRYR